MHNTARSGYRVTATTRCVRIRTTHILYIVNVNTVWTVTFFFRCFSGASRVWSPDRQNIPLAHRCRVTMTNGKKNASIRKTNFVTQYTSLRRDRLPHNHFIYLSITQQLFYNIECGTRPIVYRTK